MTRAELDEYKCSTLREGEYTCKKLTRTYVKNGKTTEEYDKLADVLASQKYYLESLEKLSEERKRLEFPHRYKVNLSNDLRELKYSLINKDVLASQKYYLESLEKLSEERKRLEFPHRYKVNLSNDLRELKYSLINKISEELNEEEK